MLKQRIEETNLNPYKLYVCHIGITELHVCVSVRMRVH